MAKILDAERLSLADAARRLNVHPGTCWRWALKGVHGHTLPTILVGGRRFVLLRDLEAFLAFDGPQNDRDHDDRAAAAGKILDAYGFTES